MPLTSGQRLGAYEITAALGSGGMGEVYRARDSRLGRDVALKVLPPDVTNEPGRLERFDREARAIAALNHPHIVTIYSTEEAGGIRFLTMELVDGCTLGDLIVSSGMAIPKFLEIALPLADALAAAHQKQIMHRDLKPGNVMVSNDGRVKVLDFGLARVGGSDAAEQTLIATQAPITHHGMIVGTMPYMSPEQVEGRTLDPRSDLFSLGVIFYELLSGSRPFAGSSSPALMSAILRDSPSSVREKRPDVPEPLDRLISRLLEKRPEDRVQTARDVFNELRLLKNDSSTGVRRGFSDRSTGENLRIAVLPFTVRGADPDAQAMAAGLTDDIAASLARFAGLAVVASQSTRAFTDSPLDVREIAARLGARYVVGGTVRKSGSAIRTTSQLIDAESAAQLWSETYDRRLEGNTDLFAIQDDVVDHIVATLADQGGVLAQSMMRSVQSTSVGESTAAQLIVRMWAFQHEASPQRHAELRARIERELESAPDSADLWALLANLYICEHSLMYNPLPDPLGRARRAALRAIELDRANQPGWLWLGLVHFHRHDRAGLEEAFDRATRINPRNAYVMAWAGNILTHVGEYERGTQLTARAMQINPAHPGWVHFSVFNRHFAEGNFEAALQAARRVNVPTFFWMHFAIASAAGHLGRVDEGRAAADTMLKMQPAFADEANLREFVTRWYWDAAVIESLLDGVGRASGRPPEPSSERPSERPASDSGVDSTFVIVVAPLKAAGGETAASLADGLTQGIAVALSRFPYLRVITREVADGRGSAGYALQGSVRASGDVIRVVVQLTEAATGASIWGQTYDRDLRSAPLFETQDALTDTIVATMADPSGALVRTMTSVVRSKPVEALTPYEAVMRRFAYVSVISSAEHALVRDALERAVTIAPAYATAWASLAGIYVEEFAQGYNPKPEPLQRARAAAHRALELDPMHPFAHASLALVHFFQKDFAAFRAARDLALAANPLDTGVLSYLGALTAYSGDWEAGLAMSERAMALNPQFPGIYRMPVILDLYRRREYSAALELLSRLNMPNYPNSLIIRAALYGQLGRIDEGRTLVRDAEAMSPGISHPDSDARRKWVPAALVDHIQQGLDKLSTSSDASHESSIAVMPFVDLSEHKDQDWFCDGIAEEILNALAPLPGLRVAARASAFSLRGKTDDLRSIGEKLNVKTVLEGSVRRAGDRVRITAQLSDAREGRQIWSERFDGEMRDIFDVQEQIARAIAERLRVTIAAGGAERLVPQTTSNIEAYQLLLQGRTFVTRRGRAIMEAIPCFERAIELDPNLSEAHALLGDTYRLLGIYGILPAAEALRLARASLGRALAIEPEQVEALATLANITHAFEWDFAAARELTDRALARDPSHVRALAESAITYATSKAEPSSDALNALILERIGRARALDPLNAWVMSIEAMVLVILGRAAEAAEIAARAIATDPKNFTAHWTRVYSLNRLDRAAEVEAAAVDALAMSSRQPMVLAELAALHARHGDVARADAIYQELDDRAKTGFVSPGSRGCAAAAAGKLEEARVLIAKAVAERDVFVTFYKLPAWEPVWADAECAAVLRSSGLMRNRLE